MSASTQNEPSGGSAISLTVDVALFRFLASKTPRILLIQRGRDPFRGSWALPGGFVDPGERLEDAARRELLEETGLEPRDLTQMGAYGDPGRDPRGHTVSVVFVGESRDESVASAGDDASDASWFTEEALPELAFDHVEIVKRAFGWIRERRGSRGDAEPDEVATILRLRGADRESLWSALIGSIERYLREVGDDRVIPPMDPGPVREWVAGFDFDHPSDGVEVLARVVEGLRRFQLHPAHPMYFGLFNPSPATMAIVADALVATVNPQLAAWSHSPFGVEVEKRLIDEIGGRFGFPAGSRDGTFASGGAEANHTAVLTAVCARFAGFSADGARSLDAEPVIYVSSEAHDSLAKAAGMSGLGRNAIRKIDVGAKLSMDPSSLRKAIVTDRDEGRVPLMVVGTAGTTSAGVIDPLPEIAKIADDEGIWFHVDAAWGGAAVFHPDLKAHLAGIEQADSITFDAHKWLSMPMGAGLYLNRHPGLLESTFRMSTRYMPREAEGLEIVDPFSVSMQWSRRFIGLKLFMTLATAGWRGYGAVIGSMAERGRELRERLEADGWRIVNDTPLPVVCFNLRDVAIDDQDERLSRIVTRIVSSGRAWISTTRLKEGRVPAIRACVTNFETSTTHLRDLVRLLGEAREESDVSASARS